MTPGSGLPRPVVGLVVLGAVGLVLIGLLWLGQRRLVFFPSPVVPSVPPAGVRAVPLTTADGLALEAWLVPGSVAQQDDDRSNLVVVFPGNGGNRVGRLPLARELARRGLDVLLVDYRGYGGNPGRPSSAGLALDARAVRDWIDVRRPASASLTYLGESLGAAVAIELASEHPPDTLVLRSPFASLADIARHHYPVVPQVLLRDSWPSVDTIARVDVPTLVVAGTADRIVPVEQSRRVAAAAGGQVQLVLVEGAHHNDPALAHGEPFVDALSMFLDDAESDGS